MNQIVTEIPSFPCNRGIMGGVGVGFHNFVAQPGGVPTCTYCGAQPTQEPGRWYVPSRVTSDVTSQPGGGEVETHR